jgi:hypothetical protein
MMPAEAWESLQSLAREPLLVDLGSAGMVLNRGMAGLALMVQSGDVLSFGSGIQAP